jgi:signal transduction histidine kinase
MLKRLAEREKRDLRERLSRDLHDDLASTLGSISIYAGTLQNTGTLTAEVRHRLTLKITELTRSALQSITDIIWMTAPRNDTMTGLFTKINALMSDILEEKGIGFDFQAQPEEGTTYLPDRIRNNLFLILKEALHNIVRHSGAGMVQLTVEKKPGGWQVYLSDNGVGFDSEEANGRVLRGHGLGNMRRRAEESGIRFEITSSKGHGTSVALFFKI